MKLFYFLELCTYFALIPLVYRSLMSIDFTKIFKKGKIQEIRLLYIFITIIISKLVGDFFIDIMEYIRIFLDIELK